MKLLQRTSFDWRSWLAGAVLVSCFFFAQVSLAATIMVDTECPLHHAIIAANTDSNGHDGDCTAGSGADIIDLTNFTSSENALVSGATISSNITIEGRGKTVGAAGTARNFTVTSSGTLTLKNIIVTNGFTSGGISAGGLANMGKTTIIDSVFRIGFTGNIFSSGTLVIRGTAIHSGNYVAAGAGININGGSLTISNSTVDSNTGTSGAGGIYIVDGATATFTHVTVWNNSANNNSNAAQLEVNGASTAVSLRNSVFCDNDANTTDLLLTGGATLRQNVGNVIGEGDAKTTATCGDLGSRLESSYYLPPSGSGALGIGNAAICKQFNRDQRGIYRPETGCDAGSVERDGLAYIYVDSGCTLSHAIQNANDGAQTNSGCESGVDDNAAREVISLTANVSLSAAVTNPTSRIVLDGKGYKVSRASGSFRPFEVASGGDFTMRNITVEGFRVTSGGGGAVLNSEGILRLEDCLFKDNSASGGGGAIHTSLGSDTIINRCAFIGNDSVNDSGGALKIEGGDFTMSNSTLVGNTCSGSGCALFIDNGGNDASMWHTTFWDNTTDTTGNTSAVHSYSTTDLRVFNSIIGNSAANAESLCGGRFINDSDERGILTWNGPDIDGCGTRTVANPNLGGQTGFPPHLPLGAGSAAIGAGINGECDQYATDQRGAARPATGCDIGAVQFYAMPSEEGGDDQGPPKTGGRWVQQADGSWDYVRPGQDEEQDSERGVCTGEALNETGAFNVSTTYGLCTGVQFNPLEISAIGIGYVIDAGPLAAVDVWGWVTAYVDVCYRGQASALFLDAATAPRTVSPLASTWDGLWTCAQISSAGTIVFLPAQSYLTTPPVDAAAPAAPADAAPLSNCMVTLNFILNFRAAPGGDVIMILPYGIKLTAFQRSGDWVQVDYHGIRGWVSASHVTFEGAC